MASSHPFPPIGCLQNATKCEFLIVYWGPLCVSVLGARGGGIDLDDWAPWLPARPIDQRRPYILTHVNRQRGLSRDSLHHWEHTLRPGYEEASSVPTQVYWWLDHRSLLYYFNRWWKNFSLLRTVQKLNHFFLYQSCRVLAEATDYLNEKEGWIWKRPVS